MSRGKELRHHHHQHNSDSVLDLANQQRYKHHHHHHHHQYENLNSVPQNDQENNSEGIFTMLMFLLTLVFLSFLIYAIFKYDTDAIKSACPDLYAYVSIRTVIGLIVFAAFFTYIFSSTEADGQCHPHSCCSPKVLHLFFVLYFLVFCITGCIIVSKNTIDNQSCVNAMADETFQTPLLGVLGWVYTVCDGLISLLLIYLFFSSLCTTAPQSQQAPAFADNTMLMMP